jgi:hypothetical protein
MLLLEPRRRRSPIPFPFKKGDMDRLKRERELEREKAQQSGRNVWFRSERKCLEQSVVSEIDNGTTGKDEAAIIDTTERRDELY